MFRDFGNFLRAVWNEWKVLLTGGSLIALTAIVSTVRGKPMPATVNWLVLGVTLMVAAFFAWRREWIFTGRGLVNIDIAKVTRLFRNNTKVHANLRVRQYMGKRAMLTGKMYDISTYLTTLTVHLQADNEMIHCYLWRWKAKLFTPIARGTLVTVNGRISDIGTMGVVLTDCELIRVEDQFTQPAVPPTSTLDQQSPPPSQE
jgi:hypothetical protein